MSRWRIISPIGKGNARAIYAPLWRNWRLFSVSSCDHPNRARNFLQRFSGWGFIRRLRPLAVSE